VYLAVKQDGTSEWEALTAFQIIDPNALPVAVEALRRATMSTAR
jgi:hypothetical protein